MRNSLWRLGTALVLSFAALQGTALAQTTGDPGAGQGSREAKLSFAEYTPPGWSAGRVSFGVGDTRPNASERVREVQRRLRGLGYAAGPIDGIFGARTEAAVRAYQRSEGLERTGAINAQTLYGIRNPGADLDNVRAALGDARERESQRKAVARGTERAERSAEARVRANPSSGSTRRDADRRDTPLSAAEPTPGSRELPTSTSAEEQTPAQGPSGRDLVLGALLTGAMIVLALIAYKRRANSGERLSKPRSPKSDVIWTEAGRPANPVQSGHELEVVGESRDESIGHFRGSALAAVTTNENSEAVYLVDDPSKSAPIWVAHSEIRPRAADEAERLHLNGGAFQVAHVSEQEHEEGALSRSGKRLVSASNGSGGAHRKDEA